jgi:hypothetical protein
MGILPVCRGHGLSRRLHEARFALLDAVARSPVPGIFIDVVAPERVSEAKLDAERRFGFEPNQRRKVFQSLGFRKVDVAYRQPVGPNGGPLETLVQQPGSPFRVASNKHRKNSAHFAIRGGFSEPPFTRRGRRRKVGTNLRAVVLDLLFFPRQTGTQTIPIELVCETMKAYWRGWLGDELTNNETQRLRSLAKDEVRLLDAHGPG